MIDLQTILEAIDQLNPEDFEKVRQRIELHRTQLELGIKRGETPDERVAILQQAFAEMREEVTDDEWQEISAAMNAEYIEPEDPELFGWLDDLHTTSADYLIREKYLNTP